MATAFKNNTALKIILGIAVAVLVFVGLGAALPWIGRQTMTAASFEQQALGDKAMGPLFAMMKELYPTEFATFVDELSRRARAGEPQPAILAYAGSHIRTFTVRKAASVVRAPDKPLTVLADEQKSLITVLAIQDVGLCAQYGATGLRSSATLNETSARAVVRTGQAMLRAAKAGEASPAPRALDDEARLDPLIERLRANGVSQEQFALMAKPESLTAAPATTQCDIYKKLYEAMAQLPDPDKAWTTAFFINEAAKELGGAPGA